MAARAKFKEVEMAGPTLYPVTCFLCGQFLAAIPEGASILCCNQWLTSKSPETLEAEKKARLKKQDKEKALIAKHKEKLKAKKDR